MQRRFSSSFVALAPAFFLGCTNATGDVQGGIPLLEASVATTTVVPDDDAGAGGDAGQSTLSDNTSADCQPGGMYGGSPATWTDLYQCYFGPTGPDSCSGQSGQAGSCHANAAASGGGNWICGATSASCYAGMMGFSLLDPQATADPTTNQLYNILCTVSGGGFMPNGCPPSTQLYPYDMNRVAEWIQAGAPNN